MAIQNDFINTDPIFNEAEHVLEIYFKSAEGRLELSNLRSKTWDYLGYERKGNPRFGLQSIIIPIEIDYVLNYTYRDTVNRSRQKAKRIYLKDYVANGAERKARKEARVLDTLYRYTRLVPTLYYSTSTRLYIHDIGGKTFRQRFDSLDRFSLEEILPRIVLRDQKLASEHPLTQAELVNGLGNKVYSAIRNLEEMSYIRTAPYGSGGKIILPSPEYLNRPKEHRFFRVQRRDDGTSILKETSTLKKSRNWHIEKTIESLLELSRIGTEKRTELEEVAKPSSLSSAIKKQKDYIESLVIYEEEDKFSQEKFESRSDEIRNALRELNMPLSNLENPLFNQFLHGDVSYPGNIIVRHNNVRFIDFGSAKFGPWMSDIVDFLTYTRLFCGISESQENDFYSLAKGLRSNTMTDSSLQNELISNFEEQRAILNVARALRVVGVLTRIALVNEIDKRENPKNHEYARLFVPFKNIQISGGLSDLETYASRRATYCSYLRESLKDCSSAKALEEILKPYLEKYVND